MTELFPTLPEAALPLLTFLLGMLVGHRFALWRDRRKDFNQAAQPVLAFLLAESRETRPNRQRPSALELHTLRAFLSVWKRKRWLQSWQRYEQRYKDALTQDPTTGQMFFRKTDAIEAAAADCLALVRLR